MAAAQRRVWKLPSRRADGSARHRIVAGVRRLLVHIWAKLSHPRIMRAAARSSRRWGWVDLHAGHRSAQVIDRYLGRIELSPVRQSRNRPRLYRSGPQSSALGSGPAQARRRSILENTQARQGCGTIVSCRPSSIRVEMNGTEAQRAGRRIVSTISPTERTSPYFVSISIRLCSCAGIERSPTASRATIARKPS
jgi:hypothetical protein